MKGLILSGHEQVVLVACVCVRERMWLGTRHMDTVFRDIRMSSRTSSLTTRLAFTGPETMGLLLTGGYPLLRVLP